MECTLGWIEKRHLPASLPVPGKRNFPIEPLGVEALCKGLGQCDVVLPSADQPTVFAPWSRVRPHGISFITHPGLVSKRERTLNNWGEKPHTVPKPNQMVMKEE